MKTEYLYRIEAIRDDYGILACAELKIRKYSIIKKTKCGVWIKEYEFGNFNDKRFVNLERRKQYASETLEKSLDCFYHKKRRQVEILTAQLEWAERQFREVARSIIKDGKICKKQY